MGSSLRLGKIFGVPVEVNVSWLFVFALLSFLLFDQYGDVWPRWAVAERLVVAVITVVMFFLSVLAHELSHSVVALSQGIPVHGITLFIFGGVSRLGQEPHGPFTEFLVAVVGPAASFVLAGVFYAIYEFLGPMNAQLNAASWVLFWGNIGLGVFNMVPGFPLDGGRVLRAAIWGVSGSYRRGTQVAARCGQAVGLAMLVGGGVIAVVAMTGGSYRIIDGLWLAVIGAFLFGVASSSYPR